MKPKLKRTIKEIPLNLIDRDSNQPRTVFDEEKISKLARSVESDDLIQVPVVKPHPDKPGRYLIVVGERRIRALNKAGVELYEFVVVEGNLPSTFRYSLVENLHRQDLDPIDEGNSYKKLREEGMTVEQIHALTGRDLVTIYNKLALLSLPSEIQQMVREGLPERKALQLRQWRGPKGDLLRKAYDLVHGKTLIELEETELKIGRQRPVRIPDSPEGLFTRVLTLAHHNRSVTEAINIFLELPTADQLAVWNALGRTTRVYLSQSLSELEETIRKILVAIADWERSNPTVAPKKEPVNWPREAPVAPPPPKVVAVPETPVQKPSLPAQTAASAARPAPLTRPQVRVPVRPVARSSANPSDLAKELEKLDPVKLLQSQKILELMTGFGNNVTPRVNLGKKRLAAALLNSDGISGTDIAEQTALTAFRLARQAWTVPTASENPVVLNFLRFIAKFRAGFGSQNFHFTRMRMWDLDESGDPIDLSKI